MPTIFRKEVYRFFFYANDHLPVHVHIEKESSTAKFTIFPLELIKSKGFKAHELSEIRKLVGENTATIEKSWYEYFGNQ